MYEKQDDGSLILQESVHCATPIDNLSIDKNGAIWAAGGCFHIAIAHVFTTFLLRRVPKGTRIIGPSF